MSKIIIGIAGEIASGKDTAGKYLADRYHALSLRFSQPIRDMLKRMNLPEDREHLAKLSFHLRQAFGEDIFSKVIIAEAKQGGQSLVVVDGVRRLPDILHLESAEHFYFVYVEASPETRYERLTKRRQNTDDATKTPVQFEKDAQLETERQIRDLKSRADFVVNNDGTLEALEAQLDEIIAKVQRGNGV